jgi:hypothetical protein
MDFTSLEIFDHLYLQRLVVGQAHDANRNAVETRQLSGAESPHPGHDLEMLGEVLRQSPNQDRGKNSLGLDARCQLLQSAFIEILPGIGWGLS